ncbi:MAG: BatA domain-containing protein [Gemmatimonadaceae bacterium]|nr:BatA domain-containing protein [Gemmatimonadaceae bacterium]
MGFLVPAFLAGLAAIGIPLLMHLRDRNEETPTRFPSLMFLVRLPIRTSDRRKVTDWPLLLLRALAVAVLVFAFSRPFIGNTAEVQADARAQRVVIALDRSMSMGHGGTWAAAQDSARALLDALGNDDQVALVLFDEEATIAQSWTRDRAAVKAVIASTTPVSRGTGFGPALRVARSALISAPPGRPSIALITDSQRSGLTGVAGLELPAGLPLRTITVGEVTRPNTSIRTVEARRVVAGDRVQLQVQARVLTRDLPAARTAKLTLTLAGREVGTRSAALAQNGELTVVFDAVAAPSSAVDGLVTIESDALAADDTVHFVLPADDALAVQLVAPDDVTREETLYFERALGIGRAPAVRVERRRPGTLDAPTYDRSALVVFWDVAPPSGAAGAALESWVESGGGVVVLVGPRLAERRSALAGVATPGGLADRRAGGGATLGEIRDEHPLFTPFRSTQAALMAPRFYRYARLDAAVGAEVLARFDDGSPAVLEREAGEGRVLAVAMGLDVRESDFPLQPAFLPLMRRVVLHGAGHESTPLWRRTGESWVPNGLRREPVIASPSGELTRPTTGGTKPAVILEQVGVYGAYEGRVEGTARDRVAVNVGPAESDLTPADPNELLLGVGESADSTFRGVTAATSIELESRQRLWRWLIAIVAVLLLAETVIASQGWRGRARRATIVSPERSQA